MPAIEPEIVPVKSQGASEGDLNIVGLTGKSVKFSYKKECAQIFNDLGKLFTVYVIAHLIECIFSKKDFFSDEFVNNMFYFAVGTFMYHIFFKNFIMLNDKP